MAFLGSALLGGMSLSAAEKAFRPWWDTIEDHIVYTIVILVGKIWNLVVTNIVSYHINTQGIIVAPTSLVMGTTLDCTFCTKDHCGQYSNTEQDPGLNIYFVRRNCALEELSPIILYFPYFLLIIATVLVMMDRSGMIQSYFLL